MSELTYRPSLQPSSNKLTGPRSVDGIVKVVFRGFSRKKREDIAEAITASFRVQVCTTCNECGGAISLGSRKDGQDMAIRSRSFPDGKPPITASCLFQHTVTVPDDLVSNPSK